MIGKGFGGRNAVEWGGGNHPPITSPTVKDKIISVYEGEGELVSLSQLKEIALEEEEILGS